MSRHALIIGLGLTSSIALLSITYAMYWRGMWDAERKRAKRLARMLYLGPRT